MQAIFEKLFDIIYLVSVITLGVVMIRKSKGRRQYILFGPMAAVLLTAVLPVQQVQAASKIEGFDVSSKNGVIGWETVAEADMDFVMLRTGEGQAPDVDEQFEANYEGAKEAGLKVGAYHVCCVRTPDQARKLSNMEEKG